MSLLGGSYYAEDDADDRYYETDFDNYVPKTNDPGPWLFIGVCIYSVICLAILPLVVMCGNRREKRRVDREEWNKSEDDDEEEISESKEETDHIGAVETELVQDTNDHRRTKVKTISNNRANSNNGHGGRIAALNNYAKSALATSAISGHSSVMSTRSKRHGKRGRMNYANLYSRASESEEMHDIVYGSNYEGRSYFRGDERVVDHLRSDNQSLMYTVDDIIQPEDAADANDPGKGPTHHEIVEEEIELTFCCGPNAMLSRKNLRYYYGVLADIAHIDNESKRMLQLGWPMTLSAGIDALLGAIGVALVANYLGTNALTAYVVTDLLVGLTDTFLAGPSESLDTLCAHAIGAENNTLAGQYVQIAAVFYLLLSTPLLAVWYFWIGDVALLLGIDETVAGITAQYTKVVVWHYLISGLFEGYNSLLDISGHVLVGSMFDIIYGIINLVVMWVLLAYWDKCTLYWLSVVELGVSVAFFIIYTSFVVYKGWLDQFSTGMFKTFALTNSTAVRNVVSTAIPLSIGSLLEYGEWEALTFFVAYLGRAEIAAWGLLESLWAIFEAATEGLTEAASIRVAYHLGKGNITMAKMSSYKALFMGVSLSFFVTSIIFIFGEDLATWLTPDETLQNMLNELIPMIGIANIFMVFGMISWTLIGAQGRYKLATTVSVCMTVFVTLPLSSISTFYFLYDLQGTVGAVICGYSTTGLVLGYFLLTSDWEHISENIQEYNANEESSSESESDSESDSDSDSGSESE